MVDRQFSKSEKHGMTESKGLTSRAFFPPGERRTRSFGSRRATEAWRGLSLDSARVAGRIAEEKGRRLAQSKGLVNCIFVELSADLFGLCRASQAWWGGSIDSARVVGQVSEESRRRVTQS